MGVGRQSIDMKIKLGNEELKQAHEVICLRCGNCVKYFKRLLNTHSLEYRRLYSDLVLCFQLLSNSFNSQLANVLIKSADNRTRGHDFKLIKQTCSVDATKYYFTNRVVNVWNSLPSHIVSLSLIHI